MSKFFDSNIVRDILKELEIMQKQLYKDVFDISTKSVEEKKQYIQLMRDFLEKQKGLLFRMTLSDDPEAKETKDLIYKCFDYAEGKSINDIFELLEKPIALAEKKLNCELG